MTLLWPFDANYFDYIATSAATFCYTVVFLMHDMYCYVLRGIYLQENTLKLAIAENNPFSCLNI